MKDYTEIIDRIIKYDVVNPGTMYLAYRLLEDLKEEISKMKFAAISQPIEFAFEQIIEDKIERRLSYMSKKYLEHDNT